MKNLIDYWLVSATRLDEPLTTILYDLEAEVGQQITLSRFGQWRRGVRGLPRAVQKQMLVECLPTILRAHGITHVPDLDNDAAYESLADALMPPDKLD